MLYELSAYIATNHALCVQWDGFILDGSAWDPSFLDFDYIGAVWPHYADGRNVGNGGFSLRSKKLLQACEQIPSELADAEDVAIGRLFRDELEACGIRIAPEAVARKFAYERTRPTGREFGFHGAFNLVRYLSPSDATRLFRGLEAGLLASNERWQIFCWAIVRRRMRLALEMLRRVL